MRGTRYQNENHLFDACLAFIKTDMKSGEDSGAGLIL